MFSKENMSIPINVAEEKVKQVLKEEKKKYDKLNAEYKNFVNKAKESVGITGSLERHSISGRKDEAFYFPIGLDTGLAIDGIKVYSGDEIRIVSRDSDINGKLGVAVIKNDAAYYLSNKESGYMTTGSLFEFARHFVEYEDREEIAKGRKGGEGFFVKRLEKTGESN